MSEPLTATLKTCPACAEEIKGEALVCRFCGQEFSSRSGEPDVPPAAPAKRKPSFALRLVLALVVVVLAFVAVLVARSVMVGEASSPSDLADRFPQAGVICTDFDVIFDDTESKALGCNAEGAQIITITTYADRPSLDEWQGLRCDSSTPVTAQGTYVFGDDFVIDILQGPYPADLVTPTPIDQVARDLAAVLGGTTGAYDCVAGT